MIVENWNRLIHPEEVVFHVGDLALGGKENLEGLAAVLNLHGHIHNNPAPQLGVRHVNLCVEVRDYRPWRLSEILSDYLPSG